jgi:anthranilate synthase component 1
MYTVKQHTILADIITPILSYQRIRENYPISILFECSEYQKAQNSHSILVFDQLEFVEDGAGSFVDTIQEFKNGIQFDPESTQSSFNGIFGYSGYNAVSKMETVQLNPEKDKIDIPAFHYGFFRFVLVFDHFNNTLNIIENIRKGESSKMSGILTLLQNSTFHTQSFELIGEENSHTKDSDFLKNIDVAKNHCQQGDVFQLVISQQFSQSFIGDEFNVYRTLRSLNPSPYLFFADFGSFKLFGSSPEAQVVVSDNKAEVHPIAGTYKNTGNVEIDTKNILALQQDAKENSEHVMLVDLARNDLSRHCTQVTIQSYKEVQQFSHVIHLVSKVVGDLLPNETADHIFAHTFPAGTLSGAPKINAMEIIDRLENSSRSFYGGGIGYFSFGNDTNHAIIIRSFCSKDNKLYFQAGAGVVIDSAPANELQEVSNKLGALRKALKEATNIHKNTIVQ